MPTVVFEGGVQARCLGGQVGGRCRACSSFFVEIFIIFEFFIAEFSESSLEGRINLWVFSSRIFGSGAKKNGKHWKIIILCFFRFSTFSNYSFLIPFLLVSSRDAHPKKVMKTK